MEMDAATLASRIEKGSPPVILDVRSGAEYASGHIPGAVNIPFWRVGALLDETPASPDDEVVVYCGHGPRAMIAAAVLRRRFRRIALLAGHWTRWVEEGRAIR